MCRTIPCLLIFCLSALTACDESPTRPDHGDARLLSRPEGPTGTPTRGHSRLHLGGDRDGALYVPLDYTASRPAPMIVALHGAGGQSADWTPWQIEAQARGIVLLMPDSRLSTWDILYGKYGDDVSFIDQALAHVFARCSIDTDRMALMGFSDGASYALSLGVANGDLFSHLIAFSPGLLDLATARRGKPQIFVSHGTQDMILFASITRNGIVPRLQRWGHDVEYHEFGDGHIIPDEIASAALDWFAPPID